MKKHLLKLAILVLLLTLPTIKNTNSYYSDEKKIVANSMSTGYWAVPAVPILTSPANGIITNPLGLMVMRWNEVDKASYYVYQSSYEESGHLTNNFITLFGVSDGTFWWRVKACNSSDVCSAWSNSWTVTMDGTLPLAVVLTVKNSWSKTVDEKIVEANWTTAGDVSFDSGTALIGKTDDDGNQVWENRLMQSFDSGAKTLSFDYDFHTLDTDGYDDPGFFVRLNGQQIFATSAAYLDTGWKTFMYDLSGYADGQKLNLSLYAGNTGGTTNQSWVYTKKITTTFVSAPKDATYHLSGFDNSGGSGIHHFEYKIDGDVSWTVWDMSNPPKLAVGSHTLTYRSQDNAGNYGPEGETKIITDDTPPSKITDLEATPYVNSVNLTWTAPLDAGEYDVRYSTSEITDANFSLATQSANIPAPKSGQIEGLEILGLNPETLYYFAIKSSDAAPNISEMSNVVSAETETGETINPGDLVINEVKWSGSDQFIELRNMTDRNISLVNTELFLNGTEIGDMSSFSIIPHGYFVVNESSSSGIFEIELFDDGESIDVAGDKVQVFTGDDTHSMERTNVPGLGSNPLSWYTCLEGNTKGVENRSVNEPVLLKPFISLSKTDKDISFKVENVGGYTDPNYELTYDTDTAPQGVVGKGSNETITLGTCSTGGTCVYHTGVKNIKLKVYLTDSLGKITILEGGEK